MSHLKGLLITAAVVLVVVAIDKKLGASDKLAAMIPFGGEK